MRCLFGLTIPGFIATNNQDPELAIHVIGSIREFGNWSIENAPPMQLITKHATGPNAISSEPRFWRLEIDLPDDIKEFEYKYILNVKEWEGAPLENRKWQRNDARYLLEGVYYTPIDYWIDSDSKVADEKRHTVQFHQEVVTRDLMYYNRLEDNLYVGSSPRLITHIADDLRSLGITAIFCLQSSEDIEKHNREILSHTTVPPSEDILDLESVDKMKRTYDQYGMMYIWFPIRDFSKTARRLVLPQAVWILKRLLDKGHHVYVHCNAGVGRSFSVVCAYYHFVLKAPLPKLAYDMATRHPPGFLHRTFIEDAVDTYNKIFE